MTSRFSERTFAALRFRNYRIYCASQVVSLAGTWMQAIAQAWLVLELTGSGTALGTVVALQCLPILVFGPMGGVVADRVDKRRLLMATQATAGALALVLGLLTTYGLTELWMVYVLAAATGFVNAVDHPGRQTFVTEMVGADAVANAVTLNSVIANGGRLIGPAVAGVLIATIGVGPCFIVNAVSYAVVVTAIWRIRVGELHPATRSRRGPGQLREGLHHAWTTAELRTTLLMLVTIGMLTWEFNITLPLFSEFTFGTGSGGLAAMTALMGSGAVVGGLYTASRGNPTPLRFASAAGAFGTIVLAVALMPNVGAVYVLMPVVGATGVSVIALSNATLQLNSSPEFRGRVMALFSVALLGSTPVGGPLVGWIGEHLGPRWALGVGGLASILAAAYGFAQFRPSADPDRARRGGSTADAMRVTPPASTAAVRDP